MPRPNYVVAWTSLKDIITAASLAHVQSLDVGALLHLMFALEHTNLDWTNLHEILQYLKAPTRH